MFKCVPQRCVRRCDRLYVWGMWQLVCTVHNCSMFRHTCSTAQILSPFLMMHCLRPPTLSQNLSVAQAAHTITTATMQQPYCFTSLPPLQSHLLPSFILLHCCMFLAAAPLLQRVFRHRPQQDLRCSSTPEVRQDAPTVCSR